MSQTHLRPARQLRVGDIFRHHYLPGEARLFRPECEPWFKVIRPPMTTKDGRLTMIRYEGRVRAGQLNDKTVFAPADRLYEVRVPQ